MRRTTQYYCYGCPIITTDFPVVNVYVTDYPVVKVHVDELSSARIWAAYIVCDIVRKRRYKLPFSIKIYYRICTVRYIRIEINHGSQNVL